MKITLALLCLRMLGRLPLGASRAIAVIAGWGIGLLPWRRNLRVQENLARAFPQLEPSARRRLARANAVEMVSTALEASQLWHRDRKWLEARIVSVDGVQHLEQARSLGRGVLLLGGHLGQWELSILYGSWLMPMNYLYKPPKSTRVDALLGDFRSRFGAVMLPSGGAAMRRALRALRAGDSVGMLFDQLPKGGHSVCAPFFGQPTATMRLPHSLIQRTGCTVVMGNCLRLPNGRGWRIVFDPVPGADDADPVVAATAMNRVLEQVIRRAPEQYLWQYRRFSELP
ncbi:MAG: lipid A biosynthesis acyltransferase [Wenzhouxiangellaceae bacterium]|nr:lipid A biosynthesis acyltransferase [Wenzhouxiangellaceae bacterium]